MVRRQERKLYHLGTPKALTDASVQVVWKASYSPFGKASITTQGLTFNLRFPGQYFDAETGLHYNWRRYYDPNTGRYITSDPLGLFDGVNTYGYVHGNPMSNTDPTGEFAWGLVFAGADLAWQLYQNGGNFKCVNWGDVAMWGLGGVGGAIGGKIGWIAGGKYVKGSGMNFSHFIPSRMGKTALLNNRFGKWLLKNGNKWNGRYVTRKRHYKHDSSYYGNVKGDRNRRLNEWGQRYPKAIQLIDRMPYQYPGAVVGAAAGGELGNLAGDSQSGGCECQK